MARVPCEIRAASLINDRGGATPGVVARCTECDHETESFGEGAASVKRCLAQMRDTCPENENNFYIRDDEDD